MNTSAKVPYAIFISLINSHDYMYLNKFYTYNMNLRSILLAIVNKKLSMVIRINFSNFLFSNFLFLLLNFLNSRLRPLYSMLIT